MKRAYVSLALAALLLAGAQVGSAQFRAPDSAADVGASVIGGDSLQLIQPDPHCPDSVAHCYPPPSPPTACLDSSGGPFEASCFEE
ncbi:hypothetical protein [Halomicrobium salinisoli]|uniref:hypothetical protein n=1 Tax=Halomicrobium salinisoli TaxID=2878391 RepID=UPI001CEFBC44|nr:hypothetical protein [Halomicrobium salinisoli]